MIGAYALGTNPIGTLEPDDEFTQTLSTLYYSMHGFTSEPADTPASAWYDERVRQPLTLFRTINGSRPGGLATETAEVVLANTDGALDAFGSQYAIDNRQITVKVGNLNR